VKLINLKKYPIHHLGIATTIQDFEKLSVGKNVNVDRTQGVSTFFVEDGLFNCYVEYFTISGRASNYEPGFNHVCYSLPNEKELLTISKLIKDNHFGIQLTKLEMSGSNECNRIIFFFLTGIGIVEFNIDD
jgi:hypothetical protein